MINFILLFLSSLFLTISFIVYILKSIDDDKIYERYKFVSAIGITSVLSLLMAIVVEIESHWSPEGEIGIGLLLLFILVIGWFIIFGFLAAFIGTPSRGEKGEKGFSKFPVVLIPSVLVSIVDIVIICGFISSP